MGTNTHSLQKGRQELLYGEGPGDDRIRRVGAGRKSDLPQHPEWTRAFVQIIEPHTAGLTQDGNVVWVSLSVTQIKGKLAEMGYDISRYFVRQIIDSLGLWESSFRKDITMKEVKDRDEQFQCIAFIRKEAEVAGIPVISVDTKKKEMLGNFKREGKALSNDYLFRGKELESAHNVRVKRAVGAAIDAGSQVAYLMFEGNSFKESLGKIDLTSVGTAFVSSLLLSPGASKGAKAATMIGLNLADAAVDYTIDEKATLVFAGEKIPEAASNFLLSFTPEIGMRLFQKGVLKHYNAQMAPSIFAPMTKDEQQEILSRKKFFESETYENLADWILSFFMGLEDSAIVEVVTQQNPDKAQNTNNK